VCGGVARVMAPARPPQERFVPAAIPGLITTAGARRVDTALS
jgi:hypothetical protein